MSTLQFTCPLIVVVPGQIIAASLWNGEFQNIFTNGNPDGIGAYSDTDVQMQTSTDPFPGGTSRPTALSGEIQRLRYIIQIIIGQTYWYQHPAIDLQTVNTDIGSFNGRFPIQTVDIGDLQVTNAKINDVASTKITGQITTAQITDASVTNSKLANTAVDENKLASSVAGNGLSGGAGSPLAVVVDGTTIQISGDTLSAISSGLGLKSIQSKTVALLVPFPQLTKTVDTTITSINTAKAAAIVTSVSLTAGSDTQQVYYVAVSFTSATNLRTIITLPSGVASNMTYQVLITVLEFN